MRWLFVNEARLAATSGPVVQMPHSKPFGKRWSIDLAIANHGGRIVKTTGELEFPSVVNAVRCAWWCGQWLTTAQGHRRLTPACAVTAAAARTASDQLNDPRKAVLTAATHLFQRI